MKYEWKKEEKYLYGAKQKAEIIDVPNQKFIMINGEVNPNLTDFSDRVSALFTLAYGIKILFKKTNIDKNNSSYKDFSVFPLEGIWRKNSGEQFDKNKLKRDLEKATKDAIKTFGDENSVNIILEKSYKDYINGFKYEETGDVYKGYIEICN